MVPRRLYTCNAGPVDHWTQDPYARPSGEGVSFCRLTRHRPLAPLIISNFSLPTTSSLAQTPSLHLALSMAPLLPFTTSLGSKAFPKERLEVFAAGKVLRLDNYRKLEAWGIPGFSTRRLLVQDKGHHACCAAFLNAIESGAPPPLPVSELFEVQRWLLEAVKS